MKFEQICKSMNIFFAQNAAMRILLPISIPIMMVCLILQWLGYFITLGGAVNAIAFLGFFFSILLVLSTCNFKMVSIGLGIFSLIYVYNIIRSLFKYHTLNWGSIIYFAVFGYLTYQCYKKSVQINQ